MHIFENTIKSISWKKRLFFFNEKEKKSFQEYRIKKVKENNILFKLLTLKISIYLIYIVIFFSCH